MRRRSWVEPWNSLTEIAVPQGFGDNDTSDHVEKHPQDLGRKEIGAAMRLEKERKEIVAFGRKLLTSGLTAATGGNLSIANRKKNLIAITPSGVDYFEMSPKDIVLVGMGGEPVEASRYTPPRNSFFIWPFIASVRTFNPLFTPTLFMPLLWQPSVGKFRPFITWWPIRARKCLSPPTRLSGARNWPATWPVR